jgi:hypothetical protein
MRNTQSVSIQEINAALPAHVSLVPADARRPSLFDIQVNGAAHAAYVTLGCSGVSVFEFDARGRKPRNHTNVAAAVRAILRALR